MPAALKGDSVQIKFSLTGDDLNRLRAFTEREGFTSINLAAKALALGAIVEYPKWGVVRGERDHALQLLRQRAWNEIATAVLRVKAEFETDDAGGRDAEATIEKGQVTFSRED